MKVGIYVRVSTQEQAEEGYSIGEQIDRLKKYCSAKDWIVVNTYTDPGYSGSNMKRPALQQMIKDVKNNSIDMVLVYKLDRLSRSQKNTLYLIEDVFLENKVEFVSMSENFDTSTPFGRAMIGILSVFAQLEREQIKERMAMGHIGRAKEGYWHGGSNPPLGYDFIDGELVINEYEAMQIREAFNLFINGETINGIRTVLQGKYTNRYSSWNNSGTVGVILRNRLYIGKIKYKGQEYSGQHKPIVSEEVFNSAQLQYSEIDSKMNTHYKSPFKGKYLLSGLMFCGNCGARYFTSTTVSKKYGSHYYYKCYSRDGNKEMKKMDGCKNPIYKVDKLDSVVMNEILSLSGDKENIKKLQKNNTPTPTNNSGIIKKRLKEIDKQLEKLLDLYQLGNISIESIGKRSELLKSEKMQLENELDSNTKNKPLISADDAFLVAHNAVEIFECGGLQEKRNIVNQLISKIVINETGIEIYWKFC